MPKTEYQQMTLRGIEPSIQTIKDDTWKEVSGSVFRNIYHSLIGKTVGIFGFGRIGQVWTAS